MDGRIVIAGGAGFIGRALVHEFKLGGYEVVVLDRGGRAIDDARVVKWDGKTVGDWAAELEGAAAVINLAGSPISVKWTDESKAKILSSRLEPTRAIGKVIAAATNPPPVWINSSGVGFYGETDDTEATESSAKGSGFVADVAAQWESAVDEESFPKTRRVKMRTATVLGRGGGAFDILLKLTDSFLGGAIGSGRQWFPWIHIADLAEAFRFCVENEIEGPVNACAPDEVTNAEFMEAMRVSDHRPWSPNVPKFALTIANAFGAPEPELLLVGTRAAPRKLLNAEFNFAYPELKDALGELIGK